MRKNFCSTNKLVVVLGVITAVCYLPTISLLKRIIRYGN